MDLGQRLRQARLDAGLSQRQLCGDAITRNMLSQIENGSARPSMTTLEYLASRLGKPISFFLEEQAVTSPNQNVMEDARRAFRREDDEAVLAFLADYLSPDPVFDEEMNLLAAMACLRLSAKALEDQRFPYAQTLLDRATQAGSRSLYYGPELERRRRILAAKLRPELTPLLTDDDDVLLVKAAWALKQGNWQRSAACLDAAGDPGKPEWALLRGKTCILAGDYAAAAAHLHRAEAAFPQQTIPLLESCYRELGDYKMAYEYACKQRKS